MTRGLIVRWARVFRIVRRVLGLALLALLLVVFFSHALVQHVAADRIVDDPLRLPANSTALLLGTSRYTRSGQRNEFFSHRMDAALDALRSGRVRGIVASGDRTDPGYNEPRAMFNALTERGVSEAYVIRDDAGFRTYDSVARMYHVFGQNNFVIISQRFHLERALFIADHLGIDAVGFPAADATGFLNLHVRLREYLARVQAVLDVYVLPTPPPPADAPVPIEFPDSFTVDFPS